MKNLNLGNVSIPITEYASQGNAILGIRDSGKSYSATYLAESLLEADIPFVAFDPIGIWKFLRVPGKGKGYPVVVAGGRNGDLPLTPQSAPEIVRAAMRENIPLVIDLYDMRLSKSDWKQIVEQSVRLLLYENGDHGLRHIFIEEAAEFAPQRVGPDQGRVYAEIEKLARMGGNARLGYTLINQRSEEVNKAILELCDCLFLHRQKGRNSITNLSKWLDIGSVEASKEIIKSMPLLGQGECWIWTAGSDVPVRVKMPVKNSFHPDRRELIASGSSKAKAFQALDVSQFVQQMSGTLEKHIQTAKENDPAELKKRIRQLEHELRTIKNTPEQHVVKETVEVPVLDAEQLEDLRKTLIHINGSFANVEGLIELAKQMNTAINEVGKAASATLQALNNRLMSTPTPKFQTLEPISVKPMIYNERKPIKDDGFPAPQQRILDSIAWLESVNLYNPKRTVVAFLAGQSPRSSGYTNNLGSLRSMSLLSYPDSESLTLTEAGRMKANRQTRPITVEELQSAILSRLPRPQRNILMVLIQSYPEALERETCAKASGQSPTSSGYTNNLGALRSLGVIEYPDSRTVRALPVLFLE